MGAAVRALAYVAGTLLVAGGSTMAAYVGPDDTIDIGSHTVPKKATGLAVATHPEITRFVGINMLVRAEAPSGVWIGSSHRVDTASLLAGVRHYEISRMALNTIDGRMVQGDEVGNRRALRPRQLVGWRDEAYGDADTGFAEVVVELDGTPTDVVAVPDRRDERITLTIGVAWEGLFRIQLAVAGIGLLLILLGVFGSWRARRRPPQAPPPKPPKGPTSSGERMQVRYTDFDSHPTSSQPTSSERIVDPAPAAPRTARPLGRRLPTPVAVPLALVLLLVLNSCASPGPAQAPTESDPAQRIAMSLPEAAELVSDPVAVHAGEFASYPMWALVEFGEPRRLRLFTRESFRSHWRPGGTVRAADVPAPVQPPRDPGRQVTRQAERALAAVAEFWTTGGVQRLQLDRRTRRINARFLESGVDTARMWTILDATYVMEVSGGWLVWSRHTLVAAEPYVLTTATLLTREGRRVLGSRLTPP